MTWLVQETEDSVHVMPLGDVRPHEADAECWCKPTPHPEVWTCIVHHAEDKSLNDAEARPH